MCSLKQSSFVAVIILAFLTISCESSGCPNRFEGFGVFLGQLRSFNRTSLGTIESVLRLVHDDLGVRHYRTEYPHEFSLQPNQVEIKCRDPVTCTWINVHRILARNYPNVKVFASIWSAPKYMLNKVWPNLRFLRTQFQSQYYHYLKRVTLMIDQMFGIKIERVSIVNEPEDVFADWDHMNLLPSTLCNLVDLYDDDLLRVCPENAWFMFTRFYMLLPSCQQSCDIIATHSYGLSSKVEAVTSVLSKKTPDVSYDPQKRRGNWGKPIWMTEVSSPGRGGPEKVVEEAIDFAKNIINYVGYTCVTRYYYWLAFTDKPSGESLIWANREVQQSDQFENDYDRFVLPKKYFVYRHFSHSSMPHGKRRAYLCSIGGMFECLRFDDNYVFVNSDENNSVMAPDLMPLCCTTRDVDYDCNFDSNSIPPQSICSSVDAK